MCKAFLCMHLESKTLTTPKHSLSAKILLDEIGDCLDCPLLWQVLSPIQGHHLQSLKSYYARLHPGSGWISALWIIYLYIELIQRLLPRAEHGSCRCQGIRFPKAQPCRLSTVPHSEALLTPHVNVSLNGKFREGFANLQSTSKHIKAPASRCFDWRLSPLRHLTRC